MGMYGGCSDNDNISRIRCSQPWSGRRRPGEAVMRRVASEFTDGAHHGEVAQIGFELQFVRRTGSRQFQPNSMNMHMGRNVQAAGMGMQKRHQTLQERQNQKQAVILGILSHGDAF